MTVRHNAPSQRYELFLDGERVGLLDYRATEDALAFVHTEIEPRLRGNGLGAELVRGALDDLRERGRRVLPVCPFVADFIADHPEYEDLLAQYSTRSR